MIEQISYHADVFEKNVYILRPIITEKESKKKPGNSGWIAPKKNKTVSGKLNRTEVDHTALSLLSLTDSSML